ncbi:UNVERIFIED_CONTAM: hypothetical protein FKN15_009084 [Acipenser sinensis]
MEMLLLKAQIEQSAVKVEPRPALSLFIKAVGRAYAGLQTLAEKSAMVSKALEYVGDILKYIKPYLVNKGPPEGLQLSYWTVGCLVKHWALILATSKAQQLLFRIIDCLLLPHALFQQDKGIPSPMLSVLRDNLPLFLQVSGTTRLHIAACTLLYTTLSGSKANGLLALFMEKYEAS